MTENTLEGNFYSAAIQAMKLKIADISNSLAHGNASSYDEYRDLCGQVSGLELSIHTLQETLSRLSKENLVD